MSLSEDERKELFRNELTKLTHKYGLVMDIGCGCCSSPQLYEPYGGGVKDGRYIEGESQDVWWERG